jgi:hypothetical protein
MNRVCKYTTKSDALEISINGTDHKKGHRNEMRKVDICYRQECRHKECRHRILNEGSDWEEFVDATRELELEVHARRGILP